MEDLKLKNATELHELLKNESDTYEYIDLLHMTLKDYQLIIDMSISKNRNINS